VAVISGGVFAELTGESGGASFAGGLGVAGPCAQAVTHKKARKTVRKNDRRTLDESNVCCICILPGRVEVIKPNSLLPGRGESRFSCKDD
jgi:hypothetical protein